MLDIVYIPAGSFMMGLPENEERSDPRAAEQQRPQHSVTLSAFHIGKYPITQAQYQSIMGENPSCFRGDNRPVETVPWYKAKEFCQKLSSKTGKIYTLPSESQWEFACRARTTTLFYFGDNFTTDLANYSLQETAVVGQFPPNAFGLYDMHGNITEWCEDTWHVNYEGAPTDGRPWVDDLPNWCFSDYYYHVLRGFSDSANRLTGSQLPNSVGFRVAYLKPN
jgi:formylglycine-generating enzyme required for sulfatase activity